MITRFYKDKEKVAEWVLECDDRISEIVQLLDKAYPFEAEDSFYYEWYDVLNEEVSNA